MADEQIKSLDEGTPTTDTESSMYCRAYKGHDRVGCTDRFSSENSCADWAAGQKSDGVDGYSWSSNPC